MAKGPIMTRIISSPTDNLRRFRTSMSGAKMITEMAGLGRTIVISRTQAGKGAGGKPFKPYSKKRYYAPTARRPPGYPQPAGGTATKSGKSMRFESGYAQYKSGIGRGNKVTLSVSGQMLGAIQIAVVSPTVAVLFFASRLEAAKAHGHQFGTTVPKREFFDLSDFASVEAMKIKVIKDMRALAKRAKLELRGR